MPYPKGIFVSNLTKEILHQLPAGDIVRPCLLTRRVHRGTACCERKMLIWEERSLRDRWQLGRIDEVRIAKNVILLFRHAGYSAMNIACRTLASVEHNTRASNRPGFTKGIGVIAYSEPRSLIQAKIVDRRLQGGMRLNLGGKPRCLRQPCLARITSLGFLKSSPGDFHGISGSIGRFLRERSLPDSNANGAKGGNNQRAREPSQSPIRLDLRSCEFVLLILAAPAGDLLLTLRFIKNDRASFLVEGSGAAILFLIGQLGVYLLCRRIYGL